MQFLIQTWAVGKKGRWSHSFLCRLVYVEPECCGNAGTGDFALEPINDYFFGVFYAKKPWCLGLYCSLLLGRGSLGISYFLLLNRKPEWVCADNDLLFISEKRGTSRWSKLVLIILGVICYLGVYISRLMLLHFISNARRQWLEVESTFNGKPWKDKIQGDTYTTYAR